MNVNTEEVLKNRNQKGKVKSKEIFDEEGKKLGVAYVSKNEIILDKKLNNSSKKYVLVGGLATLALAIGVTALIASGVNKCSATKREYDKTSNSGNSDTNIPGSKLDENGNVIYNNQTFAVNDLNTMHNCCQAFINDAAKNGISFTAEEVMSMYVMLNSQSIEGSFIELLGETITVSGLSKQFDSALVKIKEAAILDHIPDFSLIISDTNSANNLKELVTKIDNWYKSTDKEKASLEYANYIKERFFIHGYTSGVKEAGVELNMLMLTAGFNTILINNKDYRDAFTSISIDVQSLWTNQNFENEIVDCTEGKLMGTTLYSQLYRTVKETMTQKLEYAIAMRATSDKDSVDYWNQMINKLNEYITNLEITVILPSVQEMRDKYDTTIYASDKENENYIPEITEEQENNLGQDENGNTVIIVGPTPASGIPGTVIDENESVNQAQWQKGYNDGYSDAGLGKNKKDVSAYDVSYQEGYNFGYERYISLHTVEVTPTPTPAPTPYETIIPIGTPGPIVEEPTPSTELTPEPTPYEEITPIGTPAPVTPEPTNSNVTAAKQALISFRNKLYADLEKEQKTKVR